LTAPSAGGANGGMNGGAVGGARAPVGSRLSPESCNNNMCASLVATAAVCFSALQHRPKTMLHDSNKKKKKTADPAGQAQTVCVCACVCASVANIFMSLVARCRLPHTFSHYFQLANE